MIQITPQMKILLAVDPVDFRKGIDAIAQQCRQVLQEDPFLGILFVFRNRRGTSIRILTYDGQGMWLCTKRLSTGKFRWWPGMSGEVSCRLEAHQLQLLLWNGNPARAQAAPAWRPIAVQG
jgi:transposase